jgi:hypothetical protein
MSLKLKSAFDWSLGLDEQSKLSRSELLEMVRRYEAALKLIAGSHEMEAGSIARKALAGEPLPGFTRRPRVDEHS